MIKPPRRALDRLLLFANTVVGIPLALAWLFPFVLLAWIGYGTCILGVVLLSAASVDSRWLALVLGLVVVAVATQTLYVGGLLVFLLGLGSLFGVIAGDYRQRRSRTGVGSSPAVSEPP
jgi:hypothetical protein